MICVPGGLCGMVWNIMFGWWSWRLDPDGNDTVRPVNIESNICVVRLDVRFGMHRGSEALILFLSYHQPFAGQ